MKTIKDLYDFIETATRNRKYPTSTAQGLRAAVKLFDSELNDDERGSLDKVKANLDQIYQSVFAKNKNFTAASLATYKSRLLKVINDYQKYGTDPTKLANWNPKVVVRAPKAKAKSEASVERTQSEGDNGGEDPIPANMHRLELALRPGVKFIIVVPQDIKKTEAATLNAILTSLVAEEKTDE
jgi:hypothetical protein